MTSDAAELGRRTFLAGLGLSGLAATSGCAGGMTSTLGGRGFTAGDDAAVARHLAIMDAGIRSIGGSRLFAQGIADGALPAVDDDTFVSAADATIREMLSAYYVTGMFHDMPSEWRSHPDVLAALETHSPAFDGALGQTCFGLSHLPDSIDSDMREVLREEPELVMRTIEALDDHAATLGLGAIGRGKLRANAVHVAAKLRVQPAKTVIDECMSKVERVAAVHARTAAIGRLAVADATRQAFLMVAEEPPLDPNMPVPDPPGLLRARRLIRGGAWMMGLGGLLMGVGGIVVAAAEDGAAIVGAVGMTVGGIVILVGLLVLIAGLVKRSRRLRGL